MEINSVLGKTKFNQQPRKEIVISDETEHKPYVEQKVVTPSSVKNSLEILLNLNRMTDDISIDGIKFTLRTLKSKEIAKIWEDTSDQKLRTQFAELNELRLRTVAMSLTAIDGKPLSIIIGSDNIENVLELVSGLEDSVVEALYKKYEEINKKVRDVASPKEVVDSIKK